MATGKDVYRWLGKAHLTTQRQKSTSVGDLASTAWGLTRFATRRNRPTPGRRGVRSNRRCSSDQRSRPVRSAATTSCSSCRSSRPAAMSNSVRSSDVTGIPASIVISTGSRTRVWCRSTADLVVPPDRRVTSGSPLLRCIAQSSAALPWESTACGPVASTAAIHRAHRVIRRCPTANTPS